MTITSMHIIITANLLLEQMSAALCNLQSTKMCHKYNHYIQMHFTQCDMRTAFKTVRLQAEFQQ